MGARTPARPGWLAPCRRDSSRFLSVGDPFGSELRVRTCSAREPACSASHTWESGSPDHELLDTGRENESDLPPAARISRARLERWLARDRTAPADAGDANGTSPPAAARLDEDQRFEISLGLEGRGIETTQQDSRFISGSGLHGRFAIQKRLGVAYAHVLAGQIGGARRFADPIVAGEDLIVFS